MLLLVLSILLLNVSQNIWLVCFTTKITAACNKAIFTIHTAEVAKIVNWTTEETLRDPSLSLHSQKKVSFLLSYFFAFYVFLC